MEIAKRHFAIAELAKELVQKEPAKTETEPVYHNRVPMVDTGKQKDLNPMSLDSAAAEKVSDEKAAAKKAAAEEPEPAVVEAKQAEIKEGKYFTRFLLHEGTWRENSGHISMELIENGDSYLVKRLIYVQ